MDSLAVWLEGITQCRVTALPRIKKLPNNATPLIFLKKLLELAWWSAQPDISELISTWKADDYQHTTWDKRATVVHSYWHHGSSNFEILCFGLSTIWKYQVACACRASKMTVSVMSDCSSCHYVGCYKVLFAGGHYRVLFTGQYKVIFAEGHYRLFRVFFAGQYKSFLAGHFKVFIAELLVQW